MRRAYATAGTSIEGRDDMAELVNIESIPPMARGPGNYRYPGKEREKALKNGKELKLCRDDMPRDSFMWKHWENKRASGITHTAKARNLHIARRGDYIYLWRK